MACAAAAAAVAAAAARRLEGLIVDHRIPGFADAVLCIIDVLYYIMYYIILCIVGP